MTIDEAIQNLKQAKKGGTKNIILAYWDAECFGRKDGSSWASDAELVERKFDWSYTQESIETFLDIDGDDEEDE